MSSSPLESAEAAKRTWIRMKVSNPIWSVTFGQDSSSSFLAGAGADGLITLWNAFSGELRRPPLSGHTGSVLAIAVNSTDQTTLLASCGVDGTVRLWDPDNGNEVQRFKGHVGGVRDVAFKDINGASFIVSAGADGTVRLWDPRTGRASSGPFQGHAGSALCVAVGSRSGRSVLCAGGDDLTIRIWDADSGEPVMDPIQGHRGSIRALAVSEVVDGHSLLASASDDGTVRLWDLDRGQQIMSAMTGHTGSVRAVQFLRTAGRHLLVSGGVDGTIRLWSTDPNAPLTDLKTSIEGADLRDISVGTMQESTWIAAASGNGCVASKLDLQFNPRDLHRAALSRAAVVSADDSTGRDLLGRWVLTRHIIGVIAQLTAPNAAGDRSSVVVSIDGRWGSGKTTLAHVLIEELKNEAPTMTSWQTGTQGDTRSNSDSHQISATEEVVAPLRQTRPEFAKPVIIWFDAWRESAVAPHWWALAAAMRRGIRSERSPTARLAMTVLEVAGRILRSPVAVASILVVVTVVSISTLLRRSSPNEIDQTVTTLATTLTAVGALVAAGAVAIRSLFWSAPVLGQLHLRSDNNPLGEVADLVTALRRWSPKEVHRSVQGSATRSIGELLVTLGAAAAIGLLVRGQSEAALMALAACAVLLVLRWALAGRVPSTDSGRPIVLVIDELDRCSAPTVVAYLETIHTLLRDAPTARRFRTRHSKLPPLVVLVLADGRWIRTAFTTTYVDFEKLGSRTRSLGGDFLQKLFDHTVLVPDLTLRQTQNMLSRITEIPSDRKPSSTHSSSTNAVASAHAPTGPSDEPSAGGEVPAGASEGQAASKSASEASIRIRETHLLTDYAGIMPGNPRLIRRVANTWAMLEVLRLHLRHDEPDDVLARAAILSIQHPTVVDILLDSPTLRRLSADEQAEADSMSRADEFDVEMERNEERPWVTSDVKAVLRRPDGTSVDLTSIATCFGKRLS